jgi:hypothetical protein
MHILEKKANQGVLDVDVPGSCIIDMFDSRQGPVTLDRDGGGPQHCMLA